MKAGAKVHWEKKHFTPTDLKKGVASKTPTPPPPLPVFPQINDGEMARFGFRTASLISGERRLLFHFILSKIVA